jgi:hypothetical protein
MDQGVKATFECHSAICHLPDDLSASVQQCERHMITDASTCSPSLDLAYSQTRDQVTVASKTYQKVSGHRQLMLSMPCRLEE